MIVEVLSTLPGGMMHWGWIHRVKRHAVHLARSLLCTGCGLAPWKTLEHGKYAPRMHL